MKGKHSDTGSMLSQKYIYLKEPPEMFYKKVVLKFFFKIHRKTRVPESLL